MQPPPDDGAPDAEMAFGTTPEQLESVGHQLVTALAAHYGRRADTLFPAFGANGPKEGLSSDAPEQGADAGTVVRLLTDLVLPRLFNAQQPDICQLMSSPLPLLALFDVIISYLNVQPYGMWNAGLQATVVRWLGRLTGFSQEAEGIFTKGGTSSNLFAMAVARVHCLGTDLRRKGAAHGPVLTAYMSTEGHFSLEKAAELLGIGSDQLRKVPITPVQTIDMELLRQQIVADKEAGFRPFFLIANGGSARTGTVDPIGPLVRLAREFGLWLHVDGAYGAFAAMTSLAGDRFAGLDEVDSLSMDPHKWMSVPYECSCLLLREAKLLDDAFELVPDYLGMIRSDPYRGFSRNFDLTQTDKALKVWLAFQLYGVDNYRKLFESHIRMASTFADLIDGYADFQLCKRPELSIVCFRFLPADMRAEADARRFYLDNLNNAIELSLKSKNILITTARLDGIIVLRVCFISHQLSFSRLEPLAAAIHAAGSAIHNRISRTAVY